MVKKLKLFFALSLVLWYACKNDDPVITPIDPMIDTPALTKVTGYDENNVFTNANGDVFFPWGYNYTNPQIIGLIEDTWDQESTWDIIAEDFAEMRSYSANIVRIHLQYNKFMIDADTPDLVALQRLERLVQIAEDNRLYLDITGLAAYRKSDSPEWYDSLSDTERWATHAVFWKSVAATVGTSNAVFAFNLMNEPVVAVGCDGTTACDWLPGDGFGGFHFVQNIARSPSIAVETGIKDWIGQLTTAIRQEDQTTMITVGFLSLGSVTRFEDDLDYLSMHIYPKSGEISEAVAKIESNQSNKPLIIEETSSLRCSIEELDVFLNQIDGKYNGLMGHYFGKTLAEMESSGTLVDAIHKDFVEFFISKNPN